MWQKNAIKMLSVCNTRIFVKHNIWFEYVENWRQRIRCMWLNWVIHFTCKSSFHLCSIFLNSLRLCCCLFYLCFIFISNQRASLNVCQSLITECVKRCGCSFNGGESYNNALRAYGWMFVTLRNACNGVNEGTHRVSEWVSEWILDWKLVNTYRYSEHW